MGPLIYAWSVTSWRRAQTSGGGEGARLAACLNAGQNELIHDSESSCWVVGVLLGPNLCSQLRTPPGADCCGEDDEEGRRGWGWAG